MLRGLPMSRATRRDSAARKSTEGPHIAYEIDRDCRDAARLLHGPRRRLCAPSGRDHLRLTRSRDRATSRFPRPRIWRRSIAHLRQVKRRVIAPMRQTRMHSALSCATPRVTIERCPRKQHRKARKSKRRRQPQHPLRRPQHPLRQRQRPLRRQRLSLRRSSEATPNTWSRLTTTTTTAAPRAAPSAPRAVLTNAQIEDLNHAVLESTDYCLALSEDKTPSNAALNGLVETTSVLPRYLSLDPDTQYPALEIPNSNTIREAVGWEINLLGNGSIPCDPQDAEALQTDLSAVSPKGN